LGVIAVTEHSIFQIVHIVVVKSYCRTTEKLSKILVKWKLGLITIYNRTKNILKVLFVKFEVGFNCKI
jgi:hypothetical protein